MTTPFRPSASPLPDKASLRTGCELPKISVIVLTYNSFSHLRPNLDSLMALDYPRERLEVLLVDNASTDGSIEWVKEHYPTVRIVLNRANLGFAAGNSAGVRAANGEWIAILNPDTRVAPDWLTELAKLTLHDPETACVASTILSWDGKSIDFADAAMNFMGWGYQPGFNNPAPGVRWTARRLTWRGRRPHSLLFACGGAMLVRRETYLETGGFDADYFAYFEDVDLGWRFHLLGHKVIFAPRATVYHRHHGSWDQVSDAQRWVLYERNAISSMIKNYEEMNLALVLPAALLLLLQKVYLDIWPTSTPPSRASGYGVNYYFMETKRLLQQEGFGALFCRARAEAARRWQKWQDDTVALLRPKTPRDGLSASSGPPEVPAIAFSRLLAGHDVSRSFPALMQKRQAVQSVRRRTDRDVFPLFRLAFAPNSTHPQFGAALSRVITLFGLAQVFDNTAPPLSLSPPMLALSTELSQNLLRVSDRIWASTGMSEEPFRLGNPPPKARYNVPSECLDLLGEVNHLLWGVPGGSVEEALRQLNGGCLRILERGSADIKS